MKRNHRLISYFNGTKSLKVSGEMAFTENVSKLFEMAAEAIALRNDSIIRDCLALLTNANQIATSYLEDHNSEAINSLNIRINEYVYILSTYITKSINYQVLDNIEDYPFSMLIMEKLRYSDVTVDSLVDNVISEGHKGEEVEALQTTVNYLLEEGYIKEEDNVLSLNKKGENLFKSYSNSKKITNKYEKIKRQQVKHRRTVVNVELLNKIDRVPYGFMTLEVLYENTHRGFTVEELSEILGAENIQESIMYLKDMYLIDMNEECLITLLKAGENIFETYRRSKRYTNTYEKVRRRKTS